MYFVGIDLAWGERKPTGLAVLDADGRLVHVSTVQTDEEILAALKPYVGGDCLVAIDAPLIVKNATGNRPAEAALNRDFARFDAGAHPANTTKPEFAQTPRGARLSAALGLDLNPRSGRARRAIEVYPHPAIVALFQLGRTLKYKNKPGRDRETLRSQMLVLIGLIEGLATAQPALHLDRRRSGWPKLVEAVEGATRKSQLRVVEDQVDGVVCAYVALFATRNPDRTTTYGDFDEGYIVTPTLPDGLRPTPRARLTAGPDATADDVALAVETEPHATPDSGTAVRPASKVPPAQKNSPPMRGEKTSPGQQAATGQQAAPGQPVGAETDSVAVAVQAYSAQQAAITEAGQRFIALVTAILDEAGINYLSVTGRTKSIESFAGKAARRVDGGLLYVDPLRDITDQIGVRVITYVLSDVTAVADLLADQVIVKDDRDMGRETASQGRFGYASRHLLIALDAARESQSTYQQLRGRVASVQIRTVLQHAWAEFEHDIRYKGTVPEEHAREFDRRFTLAAGLLELADREFSTIRDRLRVDPAERSDPDGSDQQDDDPRIDPRELAAFLAGQYADAGWSRTDHYAWISGLLLELGVTSLAELSDVLRPVNELDLSDRMAYRYPPGAVRRLDDALLAVFGSRYLDLHGNAHRVPSLRSRLERLLKRSPTDGS